MFSSYYIGTYPLSCAPTARPYDSVLGQIETDLQARQVKALRQALHNIGFSYIGGDPRRICLDVDAFPPTYFAASWPVSNALSQLAGSAAAEAYGESLRGTKPARALTHILGEAARLHQGADPASFDSSALTVSFKELWRADPFIDPRLSAGEYMFRDTAGDPSQSLLMECLPESAPTLSASLAVAAETAFARDLSFMFCFSRLKQHITAPEHLLVSLTNKALYAVLHNQQPEALMLFAKAKSTPLRQVGDTLCDRWPDLTPLVEKFWDRTIRVRHTKELIASLPALAADCQRISNGSWAKGVQKAIDDRCRQHVVASAEDFRPTGDGSGGYCCG